MDIAVSKFFESIRNPFLDGVAAFFSLMGEPLFMVVLMCVLYWLVSKKLGERLAIISFTSMLVNAGLKSWISRPRPYWMGHVSRVEMTGLVDTMKLQPLESFPSGHSQGCSGVAFGIASHYQKRWLWIVAPIITLCVMWSRIYLGVHYLTDTLCGSALGIMFAIIWDLLYEQFKAKKYWILAGFSVFSIVIMILLPTKSTFEQAGMLIAGAIALPIEEKFVGFTDATCLKNRALRLLVGIGCVGVVFGAFSLLPFAFLELIGWKFVKYFLTVLTATLLVPFLFKKLKI